MHGLLINGHKGLGDEILINGIVRAHVATNELVVLPVKYHNMVSVAYMYRDLPNVVLRPIEDDVDLVQFNRNVWRGRRLNLGVYGGDGFDHQLWDRSFYTQADVPFEERWTNWRCDRDASKEVPLEQVLAEINEGCSWCFFHDDPKRGLVINRYPELIPPTRIRPTPQTNANIFAWWPVIEAAPMIHCISSSFALFIDSIDLPAQPALFLHAYARPGEPLPTFKKNWRIL
jgi:hypothetical protein